MAATPQLQRLCEADLDALIDQSREQGTTELILLGPGIALPSSADQWPEPWRDTPNIYQLKELLDDLAERIGKLTQLTSHVLWGQRDRC